MNLLHLWNSFAAILNEMSPYILLGFLIAGLLHVFVDPRTMSRHLSGRGLRPVIKAALLGIPLPLCSCGVLPTAVSLRRQGASKAAATSFLIATPQTGVDSIAATWSLLGLPFAVIRPVAALVGAVVGGGAVAALDPSGSAAGRSLGEEAREDYSGLSFGRKLIAAVRYGLVDMVASVGKWLVIGLVVAALITVFVPDSFFTALSGHPLLAMLAVVAIAVPMYVCATGSIPIALSLILKGLSPGIAFVMLMAGPAANFASIIILSRTQGRRATAIYVGSVVVTAVAFGLLIDTLLPASWFIPAGGAAAGCCHVTFGLFDTLCSVLLAGLLAYTLLFRKHNHHHHNITEEMKKTYQVKGMACNHCRSTVEKQIAALPGVVSVTVDLPSATATVEGDVPAEAVVNAVRLAGFEIEN
ncbi:MAG: SO_0444 family Cu/Zn efflux transporter [Duncaniella sp.]|nr:SO_0444 family Cu/Zn efflux transporter [Duncaniella sp.]